MKKVADKIYAEALYSALEKTNETDTPRAIAGFLAYLKERNSLHRTENILREFEKLYNKKAGIVNLKIKSASSLDKNSVKAIAESLGLKNFEAETKVSSELIGGFVAEFDDNLVDASLKNNLIKLHNSLIK